MGKISRPKTWSRWLEVPTRQCGSECFTNSTNAAAILYASSTT
ncbi:BnaC04g36860D [Brassica napus]|uniref:BnaC04g36860D protein n=1 Tax=Brassica napus TaxID=3708 RepID=A0A078G137_BRANA|nr:BnaC04g36860D [Brassica napus]